MDSSARDYFGGATLYGQPLTADLKQQIEDIHSIEDVTYSYLTVAYNATDHMNVSLSVSNLFDKDLHTSKTSLDSLIHKSILHRILMT